MMKIMKKITMEMGRVILEEDPTGGETDVDQVAASKVYPLLSSSKERKKVSTHYLFLLLL